MVNCPALCNRQVQRFSRHLVHWQIFISLYVSLSDYIMVNAGYTSFLHKIDISMGVKLFLS